jgi:hypothetical protein
MTRFNNKILLIALVVLLSGFVLSKLFRSPGRERNLKEKLVALDTAKVSSIQIAPAADGKKVVRLTRTGNSWTVDNGQHNAKVELAGVKNALSAVAEIRPTRMMTQKKDKWGTYNVDSTGTHVKVFTGEAVAEQFWVGKNNTGANYIRLDEDLEVYEVSVPIESYFNKTISAWRDKSFARLEPEKVSSINFQYPGDSSFVLRQEKNKWRSDNIEVDSASVARYLNKLRSKQIPTFEENFVPEAEAAYKLSFSNDSGEMLTVQAWHAPEGKWILTSSLQNEVYFSTKDSSLIRDLFPGRKTFSKK